MLSKEERLRAAVQFLIGREDLPVFAQHIHELLQTIDKDPGGPAPLAEIILESVGLTNLILRRANSVAMNRSGRRVASVSHAITLLGWYAVRDIAAGFLLFEHFQKRSVVVRNLILRATLTAHCARDIAGRAGNAPAEEAYVCGMFRHLGELLVAAYLPELYSEIELRRRRDELPLEKACQEVLQFAYEELGQRMARLWNLHDCVTRAMNTAPPRHQLSNASELLHGVTSLGAGIVEALESGSPEQFRKRLEELAREHHAVMAVGVEELTEVLAEGMRETGAIWARASVPIDTRPLERQLAVLVQPPEETAAPAPAAEAPVSPPLLDAAIAEVEALLDQGSGFALNDVLRSILECLHRGAGFERALLALMVADNAAVEGRIGAGEGSEAFTAGFRFPATAASGPVGFAVTRRQDLFIEAAGHTHSNFVKSMNAGFVAILPLEVDDTVLGCFYLERRAAAGLEARTRQQIRTLRDLAGRALSRKPRLRVA